jgi:hypothetical protein
MPRRACTSPSPNRTCLRQDDGEVTRPIVEAERRLQALGLSPSAPHEKQHDDYEDHDDEDGNTDRDRDSEHVFPPSIAGLFDSRVYGFRQSTRQAPPSRSTRRTPSASLDSLAGRSGSASAQTIIGDAGGRPRSWPCSSRRRQRHLTARSLRRICQVFCRRGERGCLSPSRRRRTAMLEVRPAETPTAQA